MVEKNLPTQNQLDPNIASRRQFMESAAKQFLGVTCAGGLLASLAENSPAANATSATTKSVIFLYMQGAMSHLDTFDPKPGTEAQGETEAVGTKIPGVQFSSRLPELNRISNKLSIVRSLTMETGDHSDANYWLHTSYRQLNSIRHPSLAAWAVKEQGSNGGRLPGSILIGKANGHAGSGFLSAKNSPLPIGDVTRGLENTKGPGYVNDEMFKRRLGLTRVFDKSFQDKYTNSQIEAYNEVYREAYSMMKSDELKVFDVRQEPEKIRQRYGTQKFGQGCLLARRLVEAGAKFVEVEFNGWDHHANIYDENSIPGKTAVMDRAMAALIEDLESRGLLESTMVVLASEFGRTPIINENAGRDHHPGAFSAVLCGGGIKEGFAYGSSDELGQLVDIDQASVEDLNATIAYGLGLPIKEEFFAPNGRPFRICNEGVPIKDLFA